MKRRGMCKIAAAAPFADPARRHMRELAESETLDARQAQVLTENLCNLLALATAPDPTTVTVSPEDSGAGDLILLPRPAVRS